MKKFIPVCIFVVLMAVGILIAAYPFVSNYLMSKNLDSEVQTYINLSSQITSDEYDEELERAEEYNKSLVGGVGIGDPFGGDTVENEEYNDLLNLDGTSVIACIEIPAINVKYPIYHGTSYETLQKGIGHMSNTSLPIGGIGSHAVLTGHTGLSDAKLFTDIDKLEIGDVFYIYVLNRTLAYRIDQIEVVEPSDTALLQIDPDEDYVTLVTCTPFGLNTHRLLVRGTRIPYEEAIVAEQNSRISESTWRSEYIFAVIVGVSVMIGILAVFILFKIITCAFGKRKDNA